MSHRNRNDRVRKRRRPSHSRRLILESLEDRRLLAVVATKIAEFATDSDNDGLADSGDVIRYTVQIDNTNGSDATGVQFSDTLDPNTTLVPGSINITPLALDDTYSVAADSSITRDAAGGLLANDFDIDGSAPGTNTDLTLDIGSVNRIGGDVTGVFAPTDNGGFSYTPPSGASGTETFQYNIIDADQLSAVVPGFVTFDTSGSTLSATNESFPGVIGNVLFEINDPAAGLFANDDGFDDFSFNPTTALGGDFALNADGTFTYNPPVGITNTTDEFTYTLMDTESGATDTASAFFTISELVWFVDDDASAGGDGRLTSPFDQLSSVADNTPANPDNVGDHIFLFDGSYSDGIRLLDDQLLIGQGVDLIVAGQTIVTGSGGQTPAITNSSGTGIDLANGNTIRGLDVGNVSTFGLFANGSNSATVDQVDINNAGVSGIDLFATSGTFTFTDTTITDPGTAGLRMNGGDSNVFFTGVSSISQSNNSGSTAVGISGGHSGGVTFAGGTMISATNGIGLQFDNADGTYDFQGTTTLNGGAAGINIFGDSAGSFTFGPNTTIDHSFETLSAVVIDGFLDEFRGTFNYDGSVTAEGSELISISQTAPGSRINFNNSGSNSLMSTGAAANTTSGEGITIFNSDGTVNINTPTTLINANLGITVDLDSAGTITFTDTTINVSDPSTSPIPVVVGDHPGTIRFTNLNITTNGEQEAAFFVGNTTNFVGSLIVDGDSNINATGDGAIKLKNVNNVDVTFNNVTSTSPRSRSSSSSSTAPIDAVDIDNVGAGSFKIVDLTASDANSGIDINTSGADFTFEDITVTDSTESGIDIDGFSGNFLLSDGDDDLDEDILTIDGTGDGFAGIDIANSSSATFTFTNVDISNTGSHGVRLSDAGTVGLSARNDDANNEIGTTVINSTNGDGINSSNTDIVITFARIGEVGTILGDGIEIINNDGNTHTADIIFNNVFGLGVPDPTGRGIFIDAQHGMLTANLNANFFATDQTTISTQDGGAEASLILDLIGNSTLTTSTAQPTMSIVGNGLNSTTVRQWKFPNQVVGGITSSSGILFDRVTFDADGDPSNGIQQVVFGSGDLDIGQVPPFTIQRVAGNGLTFLNPTGDLRIETLNIANENGTGLLVDTKGLGTTFNLDIGGGTIDTIGGPATNLDPLTGDLTFDVIDVDGGPTSGIIIDDFDGNFTANSGTIQNTTGSAVSTNEATGVTLNNMTIIGSSVISGEAAPAISATGNSMLTLRDLTITGGNSGGGADAVGTDDGVAGSPGGDGVRADGGSTVDIIDSMLTAGSGGAGGDGAGGGEGGDGGRGGNATAAHAASTINVMNSTLTGGTAGIAGSPAGIFGGINGAGGSGGFAGSGSFLNVSANSIIIGGDAVRSDINFVSSAVEATDSTVDVQDSTIQGGSSGEGINAVNGTLNFARSTAVGGQDGGAGVFVNNTNVTIINSTLTGGLGPVIGDSAFPGGFGLQVRGAANVTVTGSTVRGGDGPAEEALGSMGGSGGVGFAFEVADPGAMATIIDSMIFGGEGGLGGGGFNGSGGEGAFVGEAVVDFQNTDIIGGNGSDGASGGGLGGSNGGEGLVVSGGTVTIDGTSTVSGGNAGQGDTGQEGGTGGEGVFVSSNGGTVTIDGTPVTGGLGGNGGDGGNGGEGGHGVRVGFAVTQNMPGTANINSANVIAGGGGDGGNNGDGGQGGAGVRVFENGTANLNNSTLTGGDGGDGSGTGTGGVGGLAADNTPSVAFDPGVINNNGSTLIDGNSGTPNPLMVATARANVAGEVGSDHQQRALTKIYASERPDITAPTAIESHSTASSAARRTTRVPEAMSETDVAARQDASRRMEDHRQLVIESNPQTTGATTNAATPVLANDAGLTIGGVELSFIVDAAVDRWAETGLNSEQHTALDGIEFEVLDMSGSYLGSADGSSIRLDDDGGGYGWFVDPTPMDDSEFSSDLVGGIDLLTTVMHEMGHVLGLTDQYDWASRDDLMYGFLTLGERRLPTIGQAASAVIGSVTSTAFIGTPINIGTLPAGKSVQITFDATVNDPLPVGTTEISNQGLISGANFDAILTDDPDAAGTDDPTVTPADAVLSGPPIISVSDAIPVIEGQDSIFTVSLDRNPISTVSLTLGTSDDSAKDPDDYLDIGSLNLTFNPGESLSQQVVVTTVDDPADVEDDETFFLLAFSSTNAEIGDGSGIGVILDNDSPAVLDFGDAPENITVDGVLRRYPTLLGSDGARHSIVAGGPLLGSIAADPDDDGQPDVNASGDDTDTDGDDENVDGTEPITLTRGRPLSEFTIDHDGGTSGAVLNAWIDVNVDGDWDDAGEQFLVDVVVPAGASSTSLESLTLPADATPGISFVRVRISTVAGLTPRGLASNGEVEDFEVTIGGLLNKQTIEDAVTVEEVSQETILNVAGVSDSVLDGVDLTDEQAIIDALVAVGVDPATIIISTNRRDDGQSASTMTDVDVTTQPGSVFIGDPLNAPCDVIVVMGQLDITITETTTITQFFTDVVTITGSIATVPTADLSLAKSVDNPSADVGEQVVFTTTLDNNGPDGATGVTVLDSLPFGLAFVQAETRLVGSISAAGSYDQNTGVWNVGPLSANDSATLTVTATRTSDDPLTSVSQVATSDQFDPDSVPGNSVAGEDDQASVNVGLCLTSDSLHVGMNVLTFSCASPGSVSAFVVGTQFGSKVVTPQGVAVAVDIADAEIRAFGMADPSGVATVVIEISEQLASQTPLFQAFEFSPNVFWSNTLTFGEAINAESEPVARIREDVTNNGVVSALDALVIINLLGEVDAVSGETAGASIFRPFEAFADVNEDGRISAIDALNVIRYLGQIDTEPEEAELARWPRAVDGLFASSQFDDLAMDDIRVEQDDRRLIDGQSLN